jgi:ABC-type transporter Mla maintaining outer membrane lipid asymmetry ATPase subunit MlaF
VTGQAIARLIRDLDQRLGVTSVVVTHDIPLVMAVAERVVFPTGSSSSRDTSQAREAPPGARVLRG